MLWEHWGAKLNLAQWKWGKASWKRQTLSQREGRNRGKGTTDRQESMCVVSWMMATQRCQALIPGTCKCCKERRPLQMWLRILPWGVYPELSDWALNSVTSVLRREVERDYTDRREKGNVKIQAEISMTGPQVEESGCYQELKRDRDVFCPKASRGSADLPTTLTSALWGCVAFPASRTLKDQRVSCIRHHVCGTLLWKPREINTTSKFRSSLAYNGVMSQLNPSLISK